MTTTPEPRYWPHYISGDNRVSYLVGGRFYGTENAAVAAAEDLLDNSPLDRVTIDEVRPYIVVTR